MITATVYRHFLQIFLKLFHLNWQRNFQNFKSFSNGHTIGPSVTLDGSGVGGS